ncbi:MAG TPA: gamma-glutamylcyclotransferase family protein [Rhizomicrobium sp.]|jgi:cation transport regulator ChaC
MSGPESKTVVCFAYGSNMDTARLRSRVGECKSLGAATLPAHQLRFHKRSIDGTAKCNAHFTGDKSDRVIGVLFEVSRERKPDLDKAEGLGNGYHEQVIEVMLVDQSTQKALAYIADDTHIDDQLKPTTEYHGYVERGAKEHGLPEDYIAQHIMSVQAE